MDPYNSYFCSFVTFFTKLLRFKLINSLQPNIVDNKIKRRKKSYIANNRVNREPEFQQKKILKTKKKNQEPYIVAQYLILIALKPYKKEMKKNSHL
jgi:hypothetical protein